MTKEAKLANVEFALSTESDLNVAHAGRTSPRLLRTVHRLGNQIRKELSHDVQPISGDVCCVRDIDEPHDVILFAG